MEKARYKILAIENEAPDYIKIDPRPMGDILLDPNTVEMFAATVATSTTQPLVLMDATSFEIGAAEWNDLIPAEWQRKGDLKVRFSGRNPVTAQTLNTRWVTINNYSVEVNSATGAQDGDCTIHWTEPFKEEVDFYTRFTNLGYDLGVAPNGLKYHIEIKEDDK